MKPKNDLYVWLDESIGKKYKLWSVVIVTLYTVVQFFFDKILPFISTIKDVDTFISLITNVLNLGFILAVVAIAKYNIPFFQENKNDLSEEEKEYWSKLACNNLNEITIAKKNANKALENFIHEWRYLWFSWALFYLVCTIRTLLDFLQIPSEPTWLGHTFTLLENTANNYGTLMFIFMYLYLTSTNEKIAVRVNKPFWVLVVIIGAIIEMVFILTFDKVIYDVSEFVIKSLIGIFAGVSMMAFLGKINSRIINVPIVIIWILYLYASMQPMYVFFRVVDTINLDDILITFCLIGKVVLFLTITWLLNTKRLLYSVVYERYLWKTSKKSFEKFKSFHS